MNNRSTNHLFQSAAFGLVAIFLMAFTLVSSSTAQENAVNKIEVKDGKVYVNGEMVKELEDANRPLLLINGNDEAGHKMSFFSNEHDSGNMFAFRGVGRHGNTFEFDGMRNFDVASNIFRVADNLMWPSAAPNNLYYSSRGETDEIRQLEMKSHELARSYRSATETERASLADDLRRILEKIFDLKEKSMNERLERMTKELGQLTLRVEERHLSREDIVSRRNRELIGEKDALAW